MKTVKLFSFVLLAIAFVLGSCGKYEEGPAFSLLTKKARIVGVWQADKYVDNDGSTESADPNDDSTMEFVKDGTLIIKTSSEGSYVTFEGTWEFSSDKESVETTFSSGSFSNTTVFKIIRLKNTELWLEDSDGDQVHYIPA